VADFGISILLSAPTYTLTQIQLAQVYVDTQGPLPLSLNRPIPKGNVVDARIRQLVKVCCLDAYS
jgi:hypothetical protein